MRPGYRSSRRRFLAQMTTAALAAPAVGISRALAAPSDSVGIGLIGCGSLGVNYHLNAYLPRPDVRIVGVCDVDTKRRAGAAKIVEDRTGGKQRPGQYNDYRELLERKDLDAVIVVTPDHWHALQTIHACQAGKDVHCEKPLSLTVQEGRAMVETARRYERIVQTGSESRSKPKVRLACELVRSGRIGKLLEVHTGLGQNPFCPWEPPGSPPAGLDWDLWLGPAPAVPFHKQRCFYTFRWFKDYSGGKLTDWGAHMNDIAHWGMGMDATGPVEVEATAEYRPGNLYEFPPVFKVVYTYASGVKLISTSDEPHVTFRGTRGVIRTGLGGVQSEPREIADVPLGADDVHLYDSPDHDADWLECIRTRRRPVADIEIGHRSCTVCHLGNLAESLGRKIRWDPAAERVVGDEEANRLLSRPMRSPWRLPALVGLLASLFVGLLAGGDARAQEGTDALVKRIASGDAATRASATEKLRAAGEEAVAPLAKLAGAEDPAVARAARNALERIAHHASRPGAATERSAVAKALSSALASASSPPARNALLEVLAWCGTEESVPAVAALIDVPGSHDPACRALASIRSPAATKALLGALEATRPRDDRATIAIINSLAIQRGAVAAPALESLATESKSKEVRLAALEALAANPMAYAYVHVFWSALPEPSAASAARVRPRVWACFIGAAHSFIASGEVGAASDFLCDVLDTADSPAERAAVIVALGHASRRRAAEVVYEAAENDDPEVRAAAYRALEILRGRGIPEEIEFFLGSADNAGKVALLAVLGKRQEPEATGVIASALAHEDAAVRAAALEALEDRASPETASALIAVLVAGGPAASEGAAGVLGRLPGEDVSDAIVAAVKSAEPDGRTRLVAALAMRDDDAAKKALAEMARGGGK